MATNIAAGTTYGTATGDATFTTQAYDGNKNQGTGSVNASTANDPIYSGKQFSGAGLGWTITELKVWGTTDRGFYGIPASTPEVRCTVETSADGSSWSAPTNVVFNDSDSYGSSPLTISGLSISTTATPYVRIKMEGTSANLGNANGLYLVELEMFADPEPVSKAVSDTLLPKTTETAILLVLAAVGDTLLPKLDESASIFAIVAADVSDDLLLLLTEATSTTALATVIETLAPKLDESVGVFGTVSAADTLLPMLAEIVELRTLLSRADTLLPKIDEAALPTNQVAAADALAVRLIDLIRLFAPVSPRRTVIVAREDRTVMVERQDRTVIVAREAASEGGTITPDN